MTGSFFWVLGLSSSPSFEGDIGGVFIFFPSSFLSFLSSLYSFSSSIVVNILLIGCDLPVICLLSACDLSVILPVIHIDTNRS